MILKNNQPNKPGLEIFKTNATPSADGTNCGVYDVPTKNNSTVEIEFLPDDHYLRNVNITVLINFLLSFNCIKILDLRFILCVEFIYLYPYLVHF